MARLRHRTGQTLQTRKGLTQEPATPIGPMQGTEHGLCGSPPHGFDTGRPFAAARVEPCLHKLVDPARKRSERLWRNHFLRLTDSRNSHAGPTYPKPSTVLSVSRVRKAHPANLRRMSCRYRQRIRRTPPNPGIPSTRCSSAIAPI